MRRASRFASAFAVFTIAVTAITQAHPLGNFTINHLAKIRAQGGALEVRYVLDIAEIPTFQIMHAHGNWNDDAMRQWANDEVAVVRSGLRVNSDGRELMLEPRSANASLRPGAGGLPILRWVGMFSARLVTGSAHRIAVRDYVYADRRIGWKDIVVGAQREPTNELRTYPSALIGTPRRINAATFAVLRSGALADIKERADEAPVSGTLTAWVSPTALSDMFARRNQTLLFVLLTALAAFGLGALHAVEPGHGKALLAFTLVGARATTKQAFILAGSLTIAHTAGVLLLGIVLFGAAGFVPESIYPWITLISGAAIAVIGARALAAYVHARRHLSEPHDHGHPHRMPGCAPLNFRAAVWAAMSGGIAPCPAAIVLLLTALRVHQLGYGILVILIFSLGLASVLSGLGIAVVRGAAWLSKQSGYARFASYGPLVTALAISTAGAWTLATGLVQQGIASQAVPIAFIIGAAIAGYAFAQHGHEHPHAAAERHAT